MKTIAIFSGFTSPHLGGVERYTEKIAQQLVSLGYRIIIVTSNSHQLSPIERDQAITYYRFPSKQLFKQRYPILDKNDLYHSMLAELMEERIDFVICNTRFYLTSLMGLKLAKRKAIPSIVIEHGGGYVQVGENVKGHQLIDLFAKVYEHVITFFVKAYQPDFYAVSKRSMAWLKTFGIKAKGVIYNSVDSDLYESFKSKAYLPALQDKVIITFAGRVIKEKGILLLLEAFEQLTHKDKAVLVVAGDGPLLVSLRDSYKEDQSIIFTGKLNFAETMSLLSQSDIFVNPSIYAEGLPTAVLEAGMLKCAVLATDRGGVKEVITNPSQGIIIDDTISDIKRQLDYLIEHKEKRCDLQEAVHQQVLSGFTWEVTVRQLVAEVITSESESNV